MNDKKAYKKFIIDLIAYYQREIHDVVIIIDLHWNSDKDGEPDGDPQRRLCLKGSAENKEGDTLTFWKSIKRYFGCDSNGLPFEPRPTNNNEYDVYFDTKLIHFENIFFELYNEPHVEEITNSGDVYVNGNHKYQGFLPIIKMLRGEGEGEGCSNVLVLGGPISYAYTSYTPQDQTIISEDENNFIVKIRNNDIDNIYNVNINCSTATINNHFGYNNPTWSTGICNQETPIDMSWDFENKQIVFNHKADSLWNGLIDNHDIKEKLGAVLLNLHPYMGEAQKSDESKGAAGFNKIIESIKTNKNINVGLICTEFGQYDMKTNGGEEYQYKGYWPTDEKQKSYVEAIVEIMDTHDISWTAWCAAAGEFDITFPIVWSRLSPMPSPLELVFTEGEKLPAPSGETNYHDGMGGEAGVLRGADYKNIWEKYVCNLSVQSEEDLCMID